MEAIKIMETLTLVVTVGMIMTGIPPCLTMYKTKSTRNVPYPIFLMSAVSCLGMFHYGLIVDNPVLIFLNGIGSVMQTFYVFLFLLVVKSKRLPLLFLVTALIYEAVLYTYLFSALDDDAVRADKLGLCSSLITTFIMCLPALEVVQNIRHKNADGMPFIMLVGGTACSSCWLVYGIMLGDPNIYTPNIPGLMVSGVKLYLITLYGSQSTETENLHTD